MSLAQAGVSNPCLDQKETTGRELFVPSFDFTQRQTYLTQLCFFCCCCFYFEAIKNLMFDLVLIISHLFEWGRDQICHSDQIFLHSYSFMTIFNMEFSINSIRFETLKDNRILQLNPAVPKVFNGPYPIGIDPVSTQYLNSSVAKIV